MCIHFFKLFSAFIGLTFLVACAPNQFVDLAPVATSALPDGKITLEGKEYTLKRATALAGRKSGQEVWAIVVDGKTWDCHSANEVSCMAALNRARRGDRFARDGMGY